MTVIRDSYWLTSENKMAIYLSHPVVLGECMASTSISSKILL